MRLLTVVAACPWPLSAIADWPAANPARPSFSSNADTVPRGALQIETGVAQSDDSLSLPVGLRLGAAASVEPNLTLAPKVDDPTSFGSLGAGVKVRLPSSGDDTFRSAALGLLEVPTDDRQMGGSLALIATWAPGRGVQLDANVVAIVTDPGPGDHDGTLAPVATLSRAVWGDLSAYVETYAQIPLGGGNTAVVGASGLGFALVPACVLDASVDVGLTDAAPDYVVQGGMTLALPVW